MVTKADVKRLLSKGLTGREAAQLVLQDSWEVDHRRDGFLGKGDIQRIKGGLRTQADIQEYSRLIHAYQLVDYTLKDAKIMALEAIQMLLSSCMELQIYWQEDRLRTASLMGLPAIMTQKQYDELRARQREKLLREIRSLDGILGGRAELMLDDPEGLAEEWDESGLDGLSFLAQSHPELLREIAGDILQAIQDGKVRPVQLQPGQLKEMEKLKEKRQQLYEKHPVDGRLRWKAKDHEELAALSKQEEALLDGFFQAGSSQLRAEDIARTASSLEAWLAGSLSQEEADRLLEATYISEEQLYRAGLPDVIEWVDTYKPDYDEESKPEGQLRSFKVAILQDPWPSDLDERGYYKEPGYLEKASLYTSQHDEQKSQERGYSIPEYLELMHVISSERIKAFLAIQATIEAVSQAVGVQFTEDLEEWYRQLQSIVGLYNFYLSSEVAPIYLGMPRLAELKIGRLKSTARSLRYYRERMAIALGEDWIAEAIRALDFRPTEAGSLAEIMARELKKGKQERGWIQDEEESDGQQA